MYKTLVLGASENEERYSNKAIKRLLDAGHEVVAVGVKQGQVQGIEIQTAFPEQVENLHTITMYINADRQNKLTQEILHLNPRRIIFNPGAENSDLAATAREHGIETVEGCTLVMLSIGVYES
ncbi:MAG: CoA-binding protein [Bacteroidetes bacterium]|nr:CoA-binding protein [Bacteroidota bacterium]